VRDESGILAHFETNCAPVSRTFPLPDEVDPVMLIVLLLNSNASTGIKNSDAAPHVSQILLSDFHKEFLRQFLLIPQRPSKSWMTSSLLSPALRFISAE
jgi:hypothetical protein